LSGEDVFNVIYEIGDDGFRVVHPKFDDIYKVGEVNFFLVVLLLEKR